MKKTHRILTLSIAAILSFLSMSAFAADTLQPEYHHLTNMTTLVQNTTIMSENASISMQNALESEKKKETSQLLFPIDKTATESINTRINTDNKQVYVKPEISFANKDVRSMANAVTDKTEKEQAKIERAMDPYELGYDADSIIISYIQEDCSESIKELCQRAVIANGDEYAEELMGTKDRKIIAINLNDNKTVRTAIEQYQAMDGIVHAQPNFIYVSEKARTNILSNASDLTDKQAITSPEINTPQNPTIYDQWYLDRINAPAAWDFVRSKPHQKVRVCVLDTGCEIEHTDLRKNLNLELSKEIVRNTQSDFSFYPLLGEGYYKGIKGLGEGHGTSVVGVLGAAASNNYGIKGVASCYQDDILDIVVVDVYEGYNAVINRETSDTKTIIQGLNYAMMINAQVVNLSFGDYGDNPDDLKLEDACNSLYNNGIVIVASAGNIRVDTFHKPSDFESVISVMATNQNDGKAYFSAYGVQKDICAPGTDIATTKGLGYSTAEQGTSLSAPLVTGTVAMMLSINPKLNPNQIKSILYSTATDLGAPGKDNQFANGLLNTGKAVQASPLNVMGIFPAYHETSIVLSCTKEGASSQTKYRWEYCVAGQSQWHLISDWSASDYCTWYPDANENYVVVCRVSYFGDGITTQRQDWTVSRPQMTACINGTCVKPLGNEMLIGCTANTDKYYTAVYIYSYTTNSWIASESVKGSSCWYQAELPKGNYMAYFCTEQSKHGRKLSSSYFNFSVQ